MTPLSEGLQTVEIRLRRTCEAFARLTVETLGAGPVLEPVDGTLEDRRNSPWVELTPVDEKDRLMGFSLTLGRLPWHGVSFDNIPAGRYHVRLWTTHRFLSVPFEDQPMRDVEILPGDNRLSFDVGTVGAIELDVRREDGRPWERQVNVEMVCESWGSNIREQAVFMRKPYVLEGLPVGRYRLTMTYPSRVQADAEADGYFRVDGSRLQNVVVQQSEDATTGR